jgi:hypothetical protein
MFVPELDGHRRDQHRWSPHLRGCYSNPEAREAVALSTQALACVKIEPAITYSPPPTRRRWRLTDRLGEPALRELVSDGRIVWSQACASCRRPGVPRGNPASSLLARTASVSNSPPHARPTPGAPVPPGLLSTTADPPLRSASTGPTGAQRQPYRLTTYVDVDDTPGRCTDLRYLSE